MSDRPQYKLTELEKHHQNTASYRNRNKNIRDLRIKHYKDKIFSKISHNENPITVLAEGDSWFQYSIFGTDVIDHLEDLLDEDINNLAYPGDEARDMLSKEKLDELIRNLDDGPSTKRGHKYDFLLFSGGGNDLTGSDRFYAWFHDYEEGMQPSELLNKKTIHCAFDILTVSYEILFKLVAQYSPDTTIIMNAYDFADPNGKPVCFLGPWLQPGLDQRNIPKDVQFRRDVVKYYLQEFHQYLEELASTRDNLVIAPTQGTLTYEQWDNELHPNDDGFQAIAEQFNKVIQSHK